MDKEFEWTKLAPTGYRFILILRDLECGENYPVYFISEIDLNNYQNNIISESRIKILNSFEMK